MAVYSHSGSNIYNHNGMSQPSIIKRGNLSVLATAEFRGGQMVRSPVTKQRYVWPNPYNQNTISNFSGKAWAK
ncbi:MAG: hypothetical protein IJ529_05980 [Alphaproteobacteria bacterium]|nr:hypothetical protein [Alphaproteobacteria bacterium]MBQ8677998.1 hypothetical protein [Alphaproteobacteria bacterium]